MTLDSPYSDLPPYYETLGIEIVDYEEGYARGHMPVDESISLSGDETIVHGGAIASLADATGYWAVSAANDLDLTPTIDLRIDYLAPATDDLTAEATLVRNGSSVGVVDVTVETAATQVASGRGVFKTGSRGGGSTWSAED